MISYWLLILSIVMVGGSYFLLLVNIFGNSKRKIDNCMGFDISKEVTSNYDAINIVNSNDIMISEYDIKRNIIRLNTKNYDGDTYNDVFVSALLAGYSLVNSNNSDLFKFSFIFKKIRCVSLLPLVMVLMSYFVRSVGDAKIGIVVFLVFLVYQYMRYQIAISASDIIKNNLSNEIYSKIEGSLGKDIVFNKVFFVASLVMILRMVVIILGM